MQQSMRSAISALQAHQSFMDTVANNIANVNTPAYKQKRISFVSLLSQTINQGQSPDAANNLGGMNPLQMGLGVRTGSIDTVFTQGALQATGRPHDLAIQGDGFFILLDPNDNVYYTRDGSFDLDSDGTLVHQATGYRVADENGDAVGQLFDPAVDTDVIGWQVDADGDIVIIHADGTVDDNADTAFVGLARFPNSSGLLRTGQNLYQVSLNSGDATTGQPFSEGFGELKAGFLEQANVDLAKNLTDMIIAQRGFQANSRLVTASDQVLRELVALGR